MSEKRTPEEIWETLEEQAIEDRVAEMSAEQIDRDLKAAGFDLDAVRADADAIFEDAKRAEVAARAKEMESHARVVSLRPQGGRDRTRLAIVASGLALAALVAGIFLFRPGREQPIAYPPAPSWPLPSSMPAMETPPQMAARLRDEGLALCEMKEWQRCAEKLNDAWRQDESIEDDPRVKKARADIAKWADEKGRKGNEKPGTK